MVTEEAAKHPDKPVEVWAPDEHRIGLRPILRRVGAPKGESPLALGHHRSKGLSVPAFVPPHATVPVLEGRLMLGTWQRICLVDTNVDNPQRQVRLSFLTG